MRVVFACAGTGGHINPAIAIANIIKINSPHSEFLFIGTESGLENKLVQNAGYNIEHIRTGKIVRSFTLKNITALVNACKGIGDAKEILKRFNPDLVIGTGGYICVPTMFACNALKIPYILHESNSYPGISVKLLSKRAACVMVGFEDAISRLKNRPNVVYTGTPAKFNKYDIKRLNKEQCKVDLGINSLDKKIVLVTCGSQGAMSINKVVLEMVKQKRLENTLIILVTGDKNYDEILDMKNNIQKELNIDLDNYLKIEKFIFDMQKMYKVADLCITRSGAMTINELSIAAKPSILIPLPSAAENHQYYNAKILENIGAAKIIEQKDLTPKVLFDNIEEVLNSNLDRKSQKASELVIDDVEDRIYKCILNVLKK